MPLPEEANKQQQAQAKISSTASSMLTTTMTTPPMTPPSGTACTSTPTTMFKNTVVNPNRLNKPLPISSNFPSQRPSVTFNPDALEDSQMQQVQCGNIVDTEDEDDDVVYEREEMVNTVIPETSDEEEEDGDNDNDFGKDVFDGAEPVLIPKVAQAYKVMSIPKPAPKALARARTQNNKRPAAPAAASKAKASEDLMSQDAAEPVAKKRAAKKTATKKAKQGHASLNIVEYSEEEDVEQQQQQDINMHNDGSSGEKELGFNYDSNARSGFPRYTAPYHHQQQQANYSTGLYDGRRIGYQQWRQQRQMQQQQQQQEQGQEMQATTPGPNTGPWPVPKPVIQEYVTDPEYSDRRYSIAVRKFGLNKDKIWVAFEREIANANGDYMYRGGFNIRPDAFALLVAKMQDVLAQMSKLPKPNLEQYRYIPQYQRQANVAREQGLNANSGQVAQGQGNEAYEEQVAQWPAVQSQAYMAKAPTSRTRGHEAGNGADEVALVAGGKGKGPCPFNIPNGSTWASLCKWPDGVQRKTFPEGPIQGLIFTDPFGQEIIWE
jgi:hypothetical protein